MQHLHVNPPLHVNAYIPSSVDLRDLVLSDPSDLDPLNERNLEHICLHVHSFFSSFLINEKIALNSMMDNCCHHTAEIQIVQICANSDLRTTLFVWMKVCSSRVLKWEDFLYKMYKLSLYSNIYCYSTLNVKNIILTLQE